MAANRIILKHSWTNRFNRRYPVGHILQVDDELGSKLIRDGIADKYEGDYPPKTKAKTILSNLNNHGIER